jgi:hypothetical protein
VKTTILAVAALLLGADLRAQEYVNREFRFAISFPRDRGWAPPEIRTAATLARPQRLALVASRKSGERVTVQILDVGDRVSLDDRSYREGFRDGTVKTFPPTLNLASDDRGKLAGAPSYEMLIGGTIQDLPMNIRMVAVVANRLQYNISGYASDAAALTEGEVGRVISTFRFTEPPRLPSARPDDRVTGAISGRLAGYVLFAILLALLAVVAVTRRRAR